MLTPYQFHHSLWGFKCIVRIDKYQLKDQVQGIIPLGDTKKVKFVFLQQILCFQTFRGLCIETD